MSPVEGIPPISTLPKELIQEIFVLSEEEGRLESVQSYKNAKIIPEVAVSHVCSEWRSAALNCPELWSHFTIFSGQHPQHTDIINTIGHCRVTQFREYLSRSGSYPLRLNLQFYPDHNMPENQILEEEAIREGLVLAAFLNIERWQKVRIQLHSNPTSADFLANQQQYFLNRELPYLEDLQLNVKFVRNQSSLRTLYRRETNDLQFLCPKLRRLSLDSCSAGLCFPSLATNLVALEIHRNYRSFTSVLRWESFLEITKLPLIALHIGDYTMFDFDEDISRLPVVPPIEMLALKHMRWYDQLEDGVGLRFLSKLHAPALETLELFSHGAQPNFIPDHIFPSLHTLRLVQSGDFVNDTIRVMDRSFPSLKNIMIADINVAAVYDGIVFLKDYFLQERPRANTLEAINVWLGVVSGGVTFEETLTECLELANLMKRGSREGTLSIGTPRQVTDLFDQLAELQAELRQVCTFFDWELGDFDQLTEPSNWLSILDK